jgi:sensor histidine kinase regulating citrate/malate metabolism
MCAQCLPLSGTPIDAVAVDYHVRLAQDIIAKVCVCVCVCVCMCVCVCVYVCVCAAL